MAEQTRNNTALIILLVVVVAVAAVLGYMWWQEEDSEGLEIEVGYDDPGAAVERGGELAVVHPSGVVFARS